MVVGIPANNFGGQEPGTNAEIKTFCTRKYSVTFPMMRSFCAGADKPRFISSSPTSSPTPRIGGDIKWNFTKFLVSRDGRIIDRFDSAVKPDDPQLVTAVEGALAK